MEQDKLARDLERVTKGIANCDEWETTDKLKYLLALSEFVEKATKIIDKYDTEKPFKFEIRRLDELK